MAEKALNDISSFETVGWIVGITFGVYSLFVSDEKFPWAYVTVFATAVFLLVITYIRYFVVLRESKKHIGFWMIVVLVLSSTVGLIRVTNVLKADSKKKDDVLDDMYQCLTNDDNPKPCVVNAMAKRQQAQSNDKHVTEKQVLRTVVAPAPKPVASTASSHELEVGIAKHLALCSQANSLAAKLSASWDKAKRRIVQEQEATRNAEIAKNPYAANPPIQMRFIQGLISSAAMQENIDAVSQMQSDIKATDPSIVSKHLSDLESSIATNCRDAQMCIGDLNLLCPAIKNEFH